MINVNQITAQLARMPDQALQQYAQMHKSDPYTLSLALAESNRRKQVRQGAQMNAPQQPKVVDQEIQGMAAPMPESVGIGQLPAGNMNFADGGIVAFGSGGDVPGYADQGLIRYGGTYAGQPGAPAGSSGWLGEKTGYEGMGPGELVQAIYEDLKKKIGPGLSPPERAKAEREAQRQANMLAATQGSVYDPSQYGVAAPAPLYAGARDYSKAVSSLPDPNALQQNAAPPPGTGPGVQGAAGAKGPGQRVPPAGGPGAALAPAGLTALPVMPSPTQTYQSVRENIPFVDPTAAERQGLQQEMVSGAQERLRKRQEEVEAEGDVFAGRGERIGKREEKLKEYELTNKDLAFINAGLAIMSTPGGLATAIGKGARVGTEQYAAGLDKIRAAQERLEDAKDNLDTLRLNRADMNKKDIRAAEADIDRAKLDAKKLGIEGLMLASDLREKQAGKVYDATMDQAKTVYTGAVDLQGRQIAANAQLAAARISAGAPSAQEKMAALLGGGMSADKIEVGLRKMADISAGKFDPRKAYTEYLVAAQKTPGMDLMSYSQFVGQFAIPVAAGNNPAAAPGTVRERPPGG